VFHLYFQLKTNLINRGKSWSARVKEFRQIMVVEMKYF
jgi:hypothetical protein